MSAGWNDGARLIAALLLVTGFAPAAHAQSTAMLEHEPQRSFELSLGRELTSPPRHAPGGPAWAITGVMRWQPDTEHPFGLRAEALLIQRPTLSTYYGPGGEPITRESRAALLGVGVSGDYRIRLAPGIALVPSVGAGLVPLARGSGRPTGGGSSGGDTMITQQGSMWLAGFGLRVRRFILEQRMVGLLGAEEAVPELREYFPIVVGIRF